MKSNPVVIPVWNDPVYGQWGHAINPQSLTFVSNVDMGSASLIVRSVEVKPQSMPGDAWVPLNNLLSYITTSGVDSFIVSIAGLVGNYSHFDVRITYSSASWMQVINVNNVGSRPVPQLYIEEMYRIGYTLYIDTWVTRYNANDPNYQARMDLEYEASPGIWVVHTSHAINPAGAGVDGETIPVFLPGPPALPSPLVCFRLRLWFRHWHQAGYSDVGWTLIAETNGNNCFDWEGLSTDIEFPVEESSCCIKLYPNPVVDNVTVEGMEVDQPVLIIDAASRVVSQLTPATVSQYVVTDLSAGVYQLVQGKACVRFVKQ